MLCNMIRFRPEEQPDDAHRTRGDKRKQYRQGKNRDGGTSDRLRQTLPCKHRTG